MASHRNVYKLNDVTEASQLSRELKPTFLSNYRYREISLKSEKDRKETCIMTAEAYKTWNYSFIKYSCSVYNMLISIRFF